MWKKNRENNSNKKSGGVPSFNCFFKKSLVGLAMVGLTIASPIMLAGCNDGKDGADGTMWHTGTEQPKESQGKIGDFFLDTTTFTIYVKTESGWENKGSIKGTTGSQGEQGDKGNTGATGNGIASITVSEPAEDGLTYTYTIKFTDTSVADYVFTVKNGAKGDTGATGAAGATGNGISSITIDNDSTKTNDSQTTYIINFTDNTSYSFVVKNGTNGTNGNDGVSITGIEKTSSSGKVDTYTITYSNGKTSTFTVTNGTDGKDGATWLTGKIAPTDTQGKDGDLYLNTSSWDLYTKADGVWTKQGNIKGEKGEDGTSVYVGYDGYIWCGATRTEYKAQIDASTTDASVWEDTISVADVNAMGKYFECEYIDMSTKVVALMHYYKPNAQMTIYGNTEVTEIQFVCNKAGELSIGTANVSDVAHAGATVESLNTETTKTTSYNVVEGLNTITFDTPLVVAEDETIVLGGSGSTVGLYVAKDIPLNDEYGNFTRIDGIVYSDVISKTGKSIYADTLAVRVKVNSVTAETAVYKGMSDLDFSDKTTCYTLREKDESEVFALRGVVEGFTGTTYSDGVLDTGHAEYQGKTIRRIGFILGNLAGDDDADTTVTAYKCKNTVKSNFQSNCEGDPITLTFKNYNKNVANTTATPAEGASMAGYKWSYADCDITVGEDEILAFRAGDSGICLITSECIDLEGYDKFEFVYTYTSGSSSIAVQPSGMPIDMYYVEGVDYKTNLARLEEVEYADVEIAKATKVAEYTSGKNISILGDSLSTYSGYSNDANANTNLSSNCEAYGSGSFVSEITSVNQTWWKQTADLTGMNVLVNNSSSGSYASNFSAQEGGASLSGINRSIQLHNDTTNTNPDIIAVYMGINDLLGGVSIDDFTTAYTTIVSNIKTSYPKAEIFVFTLPYVRKDKDSFVDTDTLNAYNNAIEKIGTDNNCTVVKVYPNYSWTEENWQTYCCSQTNGYGHPTAKGMDLITNAFVDTMYNKYVTNASSNSWDSTTSNTSSDTSSAENTESTTIDTNDTTNE